MIWHMSFSDVSTNVKTQHHTLVIEADNLSESQQIVEKFCNEYFNYFEGEHGFGYEIRCEWATDNLFMLQAVIDNEIAVLARAHLVTDSQKETNRERSLNGNTDEGTYLFLDLEQDLRLGYPVERIRERVYREYED